ncbi:MAG: polysaccharide deacetylase [Hyphomicrobiales bacterium]|nr:MAG: polysaccharide deacetylase [Hyphomicrobiales bacterium]
MAGLRDAAIAGLFELAWATRLTALLRATSSARGVIFSLHRVLPDEPDDFSPNALLQVKPDFLDFSIRRIRELGYDIVDLGEGIRRLESEFPEKRFAVFTFDGAYRDNLKFALPILRRHQCPFTLYVPTALVDGVGEVWWQALEDLVAAQDALAVTENEDTDYLPAATPGEKRATYDQLYDRMRAMPEPARVALIRDLAAKYDYDLAAACRALIMDWSELRVFATEQLCTIGAQTVHHYELAKLPPEQARSEIDLSVKVIEAQFGQRPIHLSYPIGAATSAGLREFHMAKELGLRSAVTGLPGGLYRRHRDALHALPRIPLDGRFQQRRYVDVFATPALFTLLRR